MNALGIPGMTKRLLGVNLALATLSFAFIVYILLQMATPPAAVAPATPTKVLTARADTAADPSALAAPVSSPMAPAVIGSRNLFSPTRSDAPKAEGMVATAAGSVRLNLYGVVLAEERSIAYLEDPVTKRVFGYRLGDTLAGGTIRTIEAGRVVLERMHQRVDIKLHDPTRPRPMMTAAASSSVDSGDTSSSTAPVQAAPGAVRPAPPRPPLARPVVPPPTRMPTRSPVTVPSITPDSIPRTPQSVATPPTATSDDLSLR